MYGDTSIIIDQFSDHYTMLQQDECSTLIKDEFNKIGTVKPPAQAYSGPSVVPFACKERERETKREGGREG